MVLLMVVVMVLGAGVGDGAGADDGGIVFLSVLHACLCDSYKKLREVLVANIYPWSSLLQI